MPTMRETGRSIWTLWVCVFLAIGITLDGGQCAYAVSYSLAISRPTSRVIVIPFEYVRGHIFLQLELDDEGPSTIMLDTGFVSDERTILVDTSVARRLRLRRGEKLDVDGMGESDVLARKIHDIDIHLNGNVEVQSAAESINLSALSHALDHPLDGILGFAFLRDYVTVIDYTHSVLRLYPPAHYHYHGDGIQLRMDKASPVIRVKVVMPDGKERWTQLLIDTGSDSELLFYRQFVVKYERSLMSRDSRQTTYIGLGGTYTCDVVRLRNIQFGDIALGDSLMFNSPYVDLARMTAGASAKSHLDGHLGNPLLQHANVIFDPSRRRFILEPVQKRVQSVVLPGEVGVAMNN